MVKEKKTAKISSEGLDPDTQTVKIIALRNVAQMLVEEKFLDPDEAVVTINPARWIDVDGAHLLCRGSIDVERRDKAKLVVRRPECGIALDQRKTDYAGFFFFFFFPIKRTLQRMGNS